MPLDNRGGLWYHVLSWARSGKPRSARRSVNRDGVTRALFRGKSIKMWACQSPKLSRLGLASDQCFFVV